VGDAQLKKKSIRMMETYLQDKTLVFVSHNMKQVQQICSWVIVLEYGSVSYDGDVQGGRENYNKLMGSSGERTGHTLIPRNLQKGFPEEPAVSVETLAITGLEGEPLKIVRHGQQVVLHIFLETKAVLSNLKLAITVKRTLMDTFADVLGRFDPIIPRRKLERSKEISISFCTDNLSPGKHVVEIIPEYLKQSARSALDSYSDTFDLVSEEETAAGLVNLNFTIEELHYNREFGERLF